MSGRPGASDATTGLANVRDLGGLPTVDGRTTRSGVLLRSDAPQRGDDAPAGVAWPPRFVLDLRSQDELAEAHPLAASAEVCSIALAGEARVDRIAGEQPDLRSLYASILTTRTPAIVSALRALADADGPALVHCAAGKDRTGLVVALLLTAIGVERRAVLDDYARTGPNMPGVVERLRGEGGAAAARVVRLLEEHPHVFDAPPDALEGVLADLEREHGTVRAWLVQQGLDAAALDRIAERLLEPAAR